MQDDPIRPVGDRPTAAYAAYAEKPVAKKKKPLTRAGVAKVLGISISRVRALEQAGQLKPEVTPDGVRIFKPKEILAFAKRRAPRRQVDGEIAAKVFRMFKDGYPFADIVIETMQSPETVRKLHVEYRKPLVDHADALLSEYDKRNGALDERIAKQQQRRPD